MTKAVRLSRHDEAGTDRTPALRPRATVHRGVVQAQGLFLDAQALGEGEARARVLAAWTPGTQVHALLGGYVLRWPQAQAVDCARAPGLPLVRAQGVLSALPLDEDERRLLAPLPEAVVLARGGLAHAHPPGAPLEPSDWLSLEELQPVPVASLGEAPAPPPLAVAPVDAPTRASFGDKVPAASPESQALLAKLGGAPAPAQPSAPGRWANALRAWFSGGAPGAQSSPPGGWLSWLLSPVLFALLGLPQQQPPPVLPAASSGAPGPLGRLLHGLTQRVLGWTRLSRVLGLRQASYVNRMLRLFEEGNLQEALRHAIPVGGPAAEQARAMLGLPSPRQSLALSPGETRATSVLGGGEDLQSHLRRLYRQAFARLERAGQVDEAAFVLAELLHANAEAVDFLEKHGRLRLAAEMAEARGLPPGQVVRQWLLAGEPERAVLLARRTGAFAEAVLLLSRTHPERARSLRLVWAESLAEAGDFGGAVRAVRPLPEARALMAAWMERALADGGPGAAAMLAHKAAAFPEEAAAVHAAALDFLEADGQERAPEREAFARALLEEATFPVPRALARPAVRALVRDLGLGVPVPAELLQALVGASGDAALREDLPVLPRPNAPVPLASRPHALRHTVPATEVGSVHVHDAALLPSGRVLVALGEAGVLLLTRDGRRLAHFEVPAARLVVSDTGTRALALAPRGELQRVSQLDLSARRARAWCELRLGAWAPDYDGQQWFLAGDRRVMALDTSSERPRTLWQLPDLEVLQSLSRSSASLAFVGWESRGDGDSFFAGAERWRYELPSLTLRERTSLEHPAREEGAPAEVLIRMRVSPAGQLCEARLVMSEGAQLRFRLAQGPGAPRLLEAPDLPGAEALLALERNEALVAIAQPRGSAVEVRLWDVQHLRLRAELRLEGAAHVTLRLTSGSLVVGDERGRLLLVDLRSGRLTQLLV